MATRHETRGATGAGLPASSETEPQTANSETASVEVYVGIWPILHAVVSALLSAIGVVHAALLRASPQ